jgi:hypothetical protein
MSPVEQGRQSMLVTALRVLRENPDSPEVQKKAFSAADNDAQEFVNNRKGRRRELESDLAEYLTRDLIHDALDVITKAEDGDPDACKMMESLDDVASLEATFSNEQIENGVREMKIAAGLVFKQHGKHARSKANNAAQKACEKFANDDEKLSTVLLAKLTKAVSAALIDYRNDVNVKTARPSRPTS